MQKSCKGNSWVLYWVYGRSRVGPELHEAHRRMCVDQLSIIWFQVREKSLSHPELDGWTEKTKSRAAEKKFIAWYEIVKSHLISLYSSKAIRQAMATNKNVLKIEKQNISSSIYRRCRYIMLFDFDWQVGDSKAIEALNMDRFILW